jgi:hypothetical protein
VNRRSKVGLGAVAILFGAQLVPFQRSSPNPPTDHAPPNAEVAAPPAVSGSLRRACYDCHSDQPRFPWYSRLAPLSWWIDQDVDEGRRRLNFSAWSEYAADPGTEVHKLDEIAHLVDSRAMPPWYYRVMHREAGLTDSDRRAIADWVSEKKASLSSSDELQGRGH